MLNGNEQFYRDMLVLGIYLFPLILIDCRQTEGVTTSKEVNVLVDIKELQRTRHY